jgi:hypothetical protein
MISTTDNMKPSRLGTAMMSADSAPDCEPPRESGIPSVGHDRREAAFATSAHRLKARDIEAIAMSSPCRDQRPQRAGSSAGWARGGIVERWAAVVRRGLGIGR